jgi:hypothetical protein
MSFHCIIVTLPTYRMLLLLQKGFGITGMGAMAIKAAIATALS